MFFCCLLSLSVLALQVSGQSLEESLQPGNGLNMLDGVELLGLRNSIPGEPGNQPTSCRDQTLVCRCGLSNLLHCSRHRLLVPGLGAGRVLCGRCYPVSGLPCLRSPSRGTGSKVQLPLPKWWISSYIPMHRLLIHVITFSLGTMFHQQLKICHWWFYVDCESSAQFYKVNPELEDIVGRQDSTYGDSVDLEDSDYLFSPPIGDSAGGYNRRQFLRSRRFRPNNFRRIGNRATLLSDIRGTRQARFPRRRQLKAIPSSSFREDQNRKRISRQVESKRKKSDVTGKNFKNTSFEEDIQMLKKEILKALSFLK